jgi:hypothetical protein
MIPKKAILGGLLVLLLLSLGGIRSQVSEPPIQASSFSILHVPPVRHAISRVRRGLRRRIRRLRSRLRHNLAGLLHGAAVTAPRGRGPIPSDGNPTRRD